jgi:hypothetical protein
VQVAAELLCPSALTVCVAVQRVHLFEPAVVHVAAVTVA